MELIQGCLRFVSHEFECLLRGDKVFLFSLIPTHHADFFPSFSQRKAVEKSTMSISDLFPIFCPTTWCFLIIRGHSSYSRQIVGQVVR